MKKPFAKLFKNYIFVAKKLNIDLSLRPSDLSIDQYYKLTQYHILYYNITYSNTL